MKNKKSEKANLENKRGVLFMIGLVFSLGLVLLAFEWKTEPKQVVVQKVEKNINNDFIYIPPTVDKRPELPKPKIELTQINIIEDGNPIADEPDYYFGEIEEPVFEIPELINSLSKGTEEKEDTIFVIVENMPEFPGGELALRKYLANAVRYPVIAQENGVIGKIFVSFVISEKGKIEDVCLVRGGDPALNAEALRVVKTMPDWKPGLQGGKAVKVRYSVPIVFQLR